MHAMARPSRPLSFEPSRFRFGATDEVRVGAYARRQLQRRITIGVLGALLITGAFGLYTQLRLKSAAGDADRYSVRVRCVACGHNATVRVPFAQTFPMKCPACGEVMCRVVWQCRNCDTEFVPEQTGTVLRCPECGSEEVGSAATP